VSKRVKTISLPCFSHDPIDERLMEPTGKQIVYHVPQVSNTSFQTTQLHTVAKVSDYCVYIKNPDDALSPEQIATIDSTVSDLQANTTALISTAKTLRSTLASLNSTLSTSDLVANVQALEAEKQKIVDRLETLKAGKAKMVTKKERDDVEKGWKTATVASKRREKIAGEMWKIISDFLESAEQREELREQLGLDE
jgi:DNA polymerase III delta prime subunit